MAQVPPPAPRYMQLDAAARALKSPSGSRGAVRSRLNAALARNPRNASLLIDRAFFLFSGGDKNEAERDYARAMTLVPADDELVRRALWAWGWSLFNGGDDARALEKWQKAAEHHGGQPYWVPYTYPLALWRMGQKELALDYFHAAVASEPSWGNPAGFAENTRHWQDVERNTGSEVLQAWIARSQAGR